MRIVLCDDEAGYRNLLHEKIQADSFAHDYDAEVTECSSGGELLAYLDRGFSADVFFLDIQMERGGDDGIWLGRELRRRGEQGLIVYVTAYMDHVLTGYEVGAFRYLPKDRLDQMLPKVLEDIREELADSEYVFHRGGETVCVDKHRILYLESRIRQLHLVTAEESYDYYGSLEQAGEALGRQFLRCHRSFLVNTERIEKYASGQIVLQGNIPIPISRSYARAVKQRMLLEMR